MREYCGGCKETFKEENITDCGTCGRTLCFRCLAIHQSETGHRQPDPNSLCGRFTTMLAYE
jgi:hypothetical protein